MIHSLNFTLDDLNDERFDFEETPNVSDVIWNLLSSNAKRVKDLRAEMNYPIVYSSLVCLDLRGFENDDETDEFNVWRRQ